MIYMCLSVHRCVPGPLSMEAQLIYGQTVLLVCRTLLTDYISQLEGSVGR
jgi:hypothetical protein